MRINFRAFVLVLIFIEIYSTEIPKIGKERGLKKLQKKIGLQKLQKQLFEGNTSLQNVNKAQDRIRVYWPLGVVHYYVDNFQYDYLVGRLVRSVLNYLETVSCVKFVPLINKPEKYEGYSWLLFDNPNAEKKCVHTPVHNANGEIRMTIGYTCLQKQQILHTILHGIGLKDEVTHPFRDQYVRILWENIHPEYRHLFRVNSEDVSKVLSEYDPASVMHFHDRAFSRNGRATIAPLMSGLLIQPSTELSQLDQLKLRMLFGHECNKREVGELLDTCKIALSNGTKSHKLDDKDSVEGGGGKGPKNDTVDNVSDGNGGGEGNDEVINGGNNATKASDKGDENGVAGNDTDGNGGNDNEGDGIGRKGDGNDNETGDNGGVSGEADGNGGKKNEDDENEENGKKDDGAKGNKDGIEVNENKEDGKQEPGNGGGGAEGADNNADDGKKGNEASGANGNAPETSDKQEDGARDDIIAGNNPRRRYKGWRLKW